MSLTSSAPLIEGQTVTGLNTYMTTTATPYSNNPYLSFPVSPSPERPVTVGEIRSYIQGAAMPTVQARTQTLIDGYVGQILVDNEIVWQSRPKRTEAKALSAAQSRIYERTAEQYA